MCRTADCFTFSAFICLNEEAYLVSCFESFEIWALFICVSVFHLAFPPDAACSSHFAIWRSWWEWIRCISWEILIWCFQPQEISSLSWFFWWCGNKIPTVHEYKNEITEGSHWWWHNWGHPCPVWIVLEFVLESRKYWYIWYHGFIVF